MAKKIREGGYIIGKEFRPAREKMTINGRDIPATPDRYILTAVSGYLENKKDCFDSATVAEYSVEKAVFEKAEFLSPCEVVFELTSTDSGAMRSKGVSLALVLKGQLKVTVSE